ncbi:MAG: hypothetical protein NT040_13985 [Bacteroidetes bacterium]|nr:hypothetical protein [Bacteroidota bacterium]
MKAVIFIVLAPMTLATAPLPVPGQTDYHADTAMPFVHTIQIDDQVERSAEALELDQDYSSLVEDLVDLAAKPVNLNAAKEDDLDAIPFLTPAQRIGLFDYLKTYGEVFSVYELQSIPGFDSGLIQNIRPFIAIIPPSHIPALTPKNLIKYGHHDVLLRCEQSFPKAMGYQATDSLLAANPGKYYPGNPQRYYFRYTWSWFDKLRIGLAGEKDPGEQFFRGAQANGMDFYAAYISLSKIGFLKNLTIGNFRVSYGQGLTIGSGLSLGSVPGFSSGGMAINGIRPGLGMGEASYLRGAAATIKIKRVEISGFASLHPRDATAVLSDSSSRNVEEFSSFTTSGYHRTGQELAKRNAVTELVCGGNLSFSVAPNQQLGFKIGLTGLFSRYSARLMPAIHPYNQFGFRGNQNFNTGVDFQVRYRGMYFFGEISRSRNKGVAFLTGTTLAPGSRVGITLIYRNYGPSCQNLFSSAFGQNSLNANERGIYTAISTAISPKLNLSGYIDLFTFPWMKYRVDAPTRGREYGLMLGWQAARSVNVNMRFYQKNTRINGTSQPNQVIHKLYDYLTRSYRFGLEWLPCNGILLKSRIEVKEAGETHGNLPFGYLVYQEAQIKAFKIPETITLLFALFDVPDYNSRIYVYEPEVLYGYSVPAYQGQGMRTCMVTKFGIARRIDLWFRGGITWYTDRNEVGTGLDLTNGNFRAELTGQLLIRF